MEFLTLTNKIMDTNRFELISDQLKQSLQKCRQLKETHNELLALDEFTEVRSIVLHEPNVFESYGIQQCLPPWEQLRKMWLFWIVQEIEQTESQIERLCKEYIELKNNNTNAG